MKRYRVGVKAIAAVVAGIVLGFLLGGIGPRREIGDVKKRMATLERELEAAKKKTARSGGGSFLPFPGFDRVSPQAIAAPTVADAGKDDGSDNDEGDAPEQKRNPDEDMRLFRLAVDAQRMRAKQTRMALAEQARLSEKELETVDAIVATMNEKLKEHADEILEMTESIEDPDPIKALKLTHELTGILYDAQTSYQDAVGGDFPTLDQPAQEIWNFVDIGIFSDAAEKFANRPQE